MFHLDQYANVAREYLASKGIDDIQGKPVSEFRDQTLIGVFGWLIRKENLRDEYHAFEEARLGSREQRQELSIDIEKTRRFYAAENTDEYKES